MLDEMVDFMIGGDWGDDSPNENARSAAFCIRGADIPDLQRGGIGRMPTRYLKPSSLVKRSAMSGDIVVEISGGSPTQSTGRAVLVTQELLLRLSLPVECSNFCRLVRLKRSESSDFVYFWLRHLYETDAFLEYENGTTGIKNLAFSEFSRRFLLPVPNKPVLDAFNHRIRPLLRRSAHNDWENDTLATVRDALLPKLLSGEFRIRDAEKVVESHL